MTKKNELRSTCRLAALCVPLGVHKFADCVTVCLECKRAFYHPSVPKSYLGTVEIEPNNACFWLMISVLAKKKSMCGECGEKLNKKEMERIKLMVDTSPHLDAALAKDIEW